ncbi:hypothetical protein CgunFtcFv8_024231 [Champsocephalus gunnari]|uniref:Uncharacterized protein n=1 Tax=Champsocephalus gunnari TaxID=52237 RepID=A0AAN8HL40_CHAGU|nr:hypothetical protein CgunFtcFv8_024231 [Champsocephalus gunnari]
MTLSGSPRSTSSRQSPIRSDAIREESLSKHHALSNLVRRDELDFGVHRQRGLSTRVGNKRATQDQTGPHWWIAVLGRAV